MKQLLLILTLSSLTLPAFALSKSCEQSLIRHASRIYAQAQGGNVDSRYVRVVHDDFFKYSVRFDMGVPYTYVVGYAIEEPEMCTGVQLEFSRLYALKGTHPFPF